MKLLTINGVDMPSPTRYDIKWADIDSPNTGRSDNGYLNRERLRADVASIELGWDCLTTSELETINAATSGASFPVSYFVGTTTTIIGTFGKYNNATMYAGDKTISLISMKPGDERWSLSFSIIEY